MPASIPSATYRLQFHRDFNFRRAIEILPYLRDLGISHIYASPYFHASASSQHGYDVADHNKINPAVGTEEDFAAFVAELRRLGMGQVLDFVPNHMGISEPLNRWWMDVLENGPSSLYATHFDIEWQPIREELENKVLLPVLGDRYGRELEKGAFKLSITNGAFFVHYYETKLPLNPRSYPLILDKVAQRLIDDEPREYYQELLSISTSLASLPLRSETQPDAIRLRAREKEVGKRRLARLLQDEPKVRQVLDSVLRDLEGKEGVPESFDDFDELLKRQAYRLSFWRVAAEEINYRRFFDINSLAAIRVEVPEVFDAAHQLVLKMLARGDVTGLRIDHVDGLWNPRAYLERLQKQYADATGSDGERPLYLVVEKILGAEEWLPEDWPCHGTTGYEFASDLIQLLVDPAAANLLDATYAEFAPEHSFPDMVYEKKLLVTRMALASEITLLGHMLDRLSEKNRHYRDFTLSQLTAAIRETIACFPVYRTYVETDRPISDVDRLVILKALRQARQRNPSVDKPVFEFLRKVLLLELPTGTSDEERDEYARFAMKFQQCSGPIMAKGLEDTTFYNFNRLVALNEVGGDPGLFGRSPEEFHQRNQERLRRSPHTLLATATHDTKRGEDARTRIAAISELAVEWRRDVLRWTKENEKFKTQVEGQLAPSPNEEYLIYQTLLGVWPSEPLTDEARSEFIGRVQQYMIKALKEAKVSSSWVEPNVEWENATIEFIAALLDPDKGKRFLKGFVPLAERIAEIGAINSLAQTALKCCAPGVPDFYQGCELWDLNLVDPDNRRPVDYEERKRLIESLSATTPEELVSDWKSGRAKLHTIRRLLSLRSEFPELFQHGSYQPLRVEGVHAQRAVGCLREHGDQMIAVLVPRLTAPVGFPPLGKVWKSTHVELPPGIWRNVLTEEQIESTGMVPLGLVFARFPVACLTH